MKTRIKTDNDTYNMYIKSGKWNQIGVVKWVKAGIGIVNTEVLLTNGSTTETEVIITNYFTSDSIAQRSEK